MTLQEFASRLEGVKWSGSDRASALCPTHDDKNPSLSVGIGADGRILVNCHRKCQTEDIVAHLGLTMADLMPPREPGTNGYHPTEQVYDYRDEKGELLYQHVRRTDKTGDKTFLFRRPGSSPGAWVWNIQGVRRVLFGLPELLQSPDDGVIFVAEGERDVLTLRAWDLMGTTNPDGAGKAKWRREYTDWLKQHRPKARCVVLRDEDEAGHAHAAAVVSSLQREGLEVRLVMLPGLEYREKHGLDITDWKRLGNTGEDLLNLVAEAFKQPADDRKSVPDEEEERLWERWVKILKKEGARLIWTNTAEAYFQVPNGELFAVHSDEAARFFQCRSDREARFQSDKWAKAAGALRSWIEVHGKRADVVHQARVDFAGQRAWIGCEDGRTVYRVTVDSVEQVRNGADGVLIRDGVAPVLASTDPTGELARWLKDDTWAMPVGRLTLAIFSVMLVLGAQTFPARPLILGIGGKGSGKTTRLQMLGSVVTGEDTIAQAISAKDEQNEVRVVNELLAIFDNLEAAPRNSASPPEDFIASCCTSQYRSIRKMRSEGEQVRKPVTAFVASTSFSIPACLTRSDVIDRALVINFEKPEAGKVAEMTDRVPDRAKVWADLLTLLQRVVKNWKTTPDTSELRAVGFMRIARCLLAAKDADLLERSLLGFQARTAGQDELILQVLSALQPKEPQSAKDLLSYWAHLFGDDRPKSAAALGQLLKHRQGICGSWEIQGKPDPVQNVTLWSFTRVEKSSELDAERAAELLAGLVGSR